MQTPAFKEITIPILPSRAINETLAFYQALGFTVTYGQQRPNPYVVIKLRGIELHFFALKQLQPENNFSTCYIIVQDIDALYQSFREGIRGLLGKLPLRGIPRINPLKDIPSYAVRQFIVVDPSGNYIRIGEPIPKTDSLVYPENGLASQSDRSSLEYTLELGIRLADAKGDFLAAAQVLDKALAADDKQNSLASLRALVLRADLAIRLEEPHLAVSLLAEADELITTFTDQSLLKEELRLMNELKSLLV